MTDYELNQTATRGPVLPSSWGLTWRDHLMALGGWIVLAAVISVIVYYNLTILYQYNPDYRRDHRMERAFCLEVDQMFVSSQYVWSYKDNMCKRVDTEVKRQ